MTQVPAQNQSPRIDPNGAQNMSAPCPRCRAVMVYVTALPHPHAPAMRRTVFLCAACNRTRNYSLSAAMAEAYAALCPATDA
jgi:transposase-like protein